MVKLFGHYMLRSILLLALIETGVLTAAAYGGMTLRLRLAGLGPGAFIHPLPNLVIFVVTLQLVMLALGLYQRATCRDLRATLVTVLAAFPLGALFLGLVFFSPAIAVWRSIFVIAFFLAFAAILLVRLAFVTIVDMERFRRRVLVIGAGRLAARIANLQGDGRAQGFSCVEFLRMGGEDPQVQRFRECSEIPSLRAFTAENDIDEIVTAIEELRAKLRVQDLLECRLAGVRISEYSAFVEREVGMVDLDGLLPSWLIDSESSTAGTGRLFVKRAVDLLVSIVLLTITAPVMLLAGLAIALTSRGPILYRQERTGQGGKPFMLYKFRSMTVGAEDGTGPQWARDGDSRITPVGRVIRKLRIDELPQIINVVKGDMSFVGPRPERPYFVQEIAKAVPYYLERHTVRPGVTGWAQVNYPYGASIEDAKRKAQFDLYYIKNYSIFLDILTLIRTIRVVLYSAGAR